MDFLGFVQFEQYLQDMHMQYYILYDSPVL